MCAGLGNTCKACITDKQSAPAAPGASRMTKALVRLIDYLQSLPEPILITINLAILFFRRIYRLHNRL